MVEANRTEVFKLSQELGQLLEQIKDFSESPKDPLAGQIKGRLEKMNEIAHQIGGKVKDETNDLIIDVNLYLENPKDIKLSPKIFQDTQVLKNELRAI